MPSSPASDGRAARRRAARHARARTAARGASQRAPSDELARLEDRHRRALADLENYRKRAEREVERRVRRGARRLLRDWLEAVDSVERALRLERRTTRRRRACARVLEQMEAILARQGVTAHRRGRRAVRPAAPRGGRRAPSRRRARPHGRRRRALGLLAGRPRAAAGAGRRVARVRRRRTDGGRLPATTTRRSASARGQHRGHPPRLPQARARVPPRRQQGPGRRGPLQGDLRGLRGAARPREARALRPARARTGRPGQDVSGAGASSGGAGTASASATARATSASAIRRRRLQRLLRGPVRRRRAGARGGGRRQRGLRRLRDCAAATTRRCSSSRSRRPRAAASAASRSATAATTRSTIPPACATASASGSPARAAGRGGGPPGDLFLRVRLRPHPRFRVDGRDLDVDLPVAPWEAALGATVEVPTLDGTRAREGAGRLLSRPPAAAARRGHARPARRAGRPLRRRQDRRAQEARATRSASSSSGSPRCRASTRGRALMTAARDARAVARRRRPRPPLVASTRSRARPACTPSWSRLVALGPARAARRHAVAPLFRRDAAARARARGAPAPRPRPRLRRRGARLRAARPHRRAGGAAAPLRATTREVTRWTRTG